MGANALEIRSLREAYERLKEAGSTSDFPELLSNVVNKVLLDSYRGVTSTWRNWVKISPPVKDFKEVKRIRMSEAEGILQVGEYEGYKDSSVDEASVSYRVYKYGRKFGISWEALINDDLGAIRQQPERFGRSAGRTLARSNVALLEGITPSTTVTEALSESSLEKAIREFKTRTDSKGELIGAAPRRLIVPPALEWTARRILRSGTLIAIGVGSSAAVQGDYNPMSESGLQLDVEPYLTDENNWYLAADPNDLPGIEVAFLQAIGEQPQLHMKKSDWSDDPFAGSFDNDMIEFRVRHAWGGTVLDANALLKVAVA